MVRGTDVGLTVRYRLDDVVVDVGRREVLRGETKLPISGLSFDLFLTLIRSAPEVATYDQLAERVWSGLEVSPENIAQRVKLLREALDDHARAPRYIAVVRSRGYRIVAQVIEEEIVGPVAFPAVAASTSVNGATASTPRRHWRIAVPLAVAAIGAIAWLAYAPVPHVTAYRQVTQSRDVFAPRASPVPIVSDGPRLYFSEWARAEGAVGNIPRQVSIKGGASIPLAVELDPQRPHVVLGVTPDRAELVVGIGPFEDAEPELWVWALAGAARRLGDLYGHDIAWSPDGHRLIVANASDLFSADRDGTHPVKLFSTSARVYWPRISPDGSRIRFTLRQGETFTLWEATIDGRDVHALLEGSDGFAYACCGSWTPDGRHYVFEAARDGASQLWSLPGTGGPFDFRSRNPIQLTPGPMQFVRPLIAPDGKSIYAIGTHYIGEVMAYDPTLQRFVNQLEQRGAEWISYAKDGTRIAYVSYPDGSLWRRRVDGTDPKRLTPPRMVAIASAWSPDGSTVAFEVKLPDQVSIYVVDADGATEPRPLTSLSRREWSPTWSPDGRRLAFSTEQGIRVIDLATRDESSIDDATTRAFPSWSPDGRYLAAIDGGERIVRYDFENKRWDDVAVIERAWYLRWSPDSAQLFVATRGLAVFAIRAEDQHVELRASAEQEPSLAGVAGVWIGVTLDGWPMYLRDARLQQIYALDWEP